MQQSLNARAFTPKEQELYGGNENLTGSEYFEGALAKLNEAIVNHDTVIALNNRLKAQGGIDRTTAEAFLDTDPEALKRPASHHSITPSLTHYDEALESGAELEVRCEEHRRAEAVKLVESLSSTSVQFLSDMDEARLKSLGRAVKIFLAADEDLQKQTDQVLYEAAVNEARTDLGAIKAYFFDLRENFGPLATIEKIINPEKKDLTHEIDLEFLPTFEFSHDVEFNKLNWDMENPTEFIPSYADWAERVHASIKRAETFCQDFVKKALDLLSEEPKEGEQDYMPWTRDVEACSILDIVKVCMAYVKALCEALMAVNSFVLSAVESNIGGVYDA